MISLTFSQPGVERRRGPHSPSPSLGLSELPPQLSVNDVARRGRGGSAPRVERRSSDVGSTLPLNDSQVLRDVPLRGKAATRPLVLHDYECSEVLPT